VERLRKPGYRIDLRALHALCEANYARLMRLFPNYETCNQREFAVGGDRVVFDVVERSRYTTIFRLQSKARESHWLMPINMEVRAYHDAGMLEVAAFQAVNRVAGRYTYPNARMHQEDEKNQQNAFLADWLSHCLDCGLSAHPPGLRKQS
jgi:uncharacterized protein YqiB (DUF1249 family)